MKKSFYIILFLAVLGLAAKAQKLPEVQSAGQWSPSTIRIDGKDQEWNNTFAANNKRVDVFYTICNDEKNIYLVVKSSNKDIAAKIIAGGISVAINTQGKKRESYTLTYPLIKRTTTGGGNRGAGQNRQNGGFQTRSEQSQSQRDSAQLVLRKSQLAQVKEIKVKGFSQIEDSLVSIYNEFGIKAAASFDDGGDILCEFAIPFAMLDISYDNVKDLMYQIKLNGRTNPTNFAMVEKAGGNFGGGQGNSRGNFGGGNNRMGMGGGNNNNLELTTATDFWGKYNVYKK